MKFLDLFKGGRGIARMPAPARSAGSPKWSTAEQPYYGEARFIAIGILRNQVVVIAYTERSENIRIISARKATKNEQIYYFRPISN